MKDKKIILFIYIFVMFTLFFVSLTNILIDDNYKKIYDISIILDDVDSDKFAKLKMGIEDSSIDLFVDINYIYLENRNVDEQKNAIQYALEKDVDGIVILPVDADEINGFLNEISINVPIISITQNMVNEKVSGSISTDFIELGKKLGGEIIKNTETKNVVCFTEKGKSDAGIYKSLATVLVSHGFNSELVYYSEMDFEDRVNDFSKEATIFVSLDFYTTSKFIKDYLIEDDLIFYGFGYKNGYINYLYNKKIEGLIFYDEYLMGYLGVQKLTNALEGNIVYKNENVPNYLVLKDEVNNYENILFPVE
ncbi:MAG: sugar ABC transporter substrate-binding protein [Lachnospirales bacterium]